MAATYLRHCGCELRDQTCHEVTPESCERGRRALELCAAADLGGPFLAVERRLDDVRSALVIDAPVLVEVAAAEDVGGALIEENGLDPAGGEGAGQGPGAGFPFGGDGQMLWGAGGVHEHSKGRAPAIARRRAEGEVTRCGEQLGGGAGLLARRRHGVHNPFSQS